MICFPIVKMTENTEVIFFAQKEIFAELILRESENGNIH